MKFIVEFIILFLVPFFTYSHQHILIKLSPNCVKPLIVKLKYINYTMGGGSI